jgi:hypothetical protein
LGQGMETLNLTIKTWILDAWLGYLGSTSVVKWEI